MPPRFAYWTILIDSQPTAFRSRDQEELLPTLNQLRRKNSDVVMKWFARGRLWDTPEQAQWAGKNLKGSEEKRGKDWRPGGKHMDPRARFEMRKDKRNKDHRDHRQARSNNVSDVTKVLGPLQEKAGGTTQVVRLADKKPFRPADKRDNEHDGRWRDKKPGGAGRQRPWRDHPSSGAARSGGQRRNNPVPGASMDGRPWRDSPVPGAGSSKRKRPGRDSPAPGAGLVAHSPDAQVSPKRQKGGEQG